MGKMLSRRQMQHLCICLALGLLLSSLWQAAAWSRTQLHTDARSWAARNLFTLQLAARHALARCGVNAPVQVQLVNMYFPARQYTGGCLPAGRYDAVRITIGSGSGQNWWCVLYPGLCRAACGGYALPKGVCYPLWRSLLIIPCSIGAPPARMWPWCRPGSTVSVMPAPGMTP